MKKLFEPCNHDFVDTNIFKNPEQFGKFCSICGTPENYPEGFTYKYRLLLISKGFITAWRKLPVAFKIIDFKSLWIFINSLLAGISTILVVLVLPFLFLLYPLFALFSYCSKRKWLRKTALDSIRDNK